MSQPTNMQIDAIRSATRPLRLTLPTATRHFSLDGYKQGGAAEASALNW